MEAERLQETFCFARERQKISCLHTQQVSAGFDFASYNLLLLTEMSAAVSKMLTL